MSRIDLAHTNLATKSVKENFDSIRWTPLTKSILSQLYDIAPVALSCNSSDGARIDKAYETTTSNGEFELGSVEGLSKHFAPNLDWSQEQFCHLSKSADEAKLDQDDDYF